MAKVSVKNLSKIFAGSGSGERPAVHDISLETQNREFVVLTGPSGCGKTTLLRMIAGLEDVSSGDILVGDKRVNGLKPSARDAAMVFPDDALYPAMSIRQNIAFGLKLRKFSRTEIERRVQDAATVLGIAEILEQRPRELSAVQRQRASIARAIGRQPKVLLFDEPLAQFEAGTRAQMRADIRKLHERLESTVIYATRDASEGMALAARVVVLHEGRVEQDDLLAAVYNAPTNLFVARFFGAEPMNLISGTLKLERDFLVFNERGEGTIRARIPLSDRPAVGELVGKEALLGIRPEDVEIVSVSKGQETAEMFPALVDFAETVGAETTLHLQTGAHAIVARGRGGDQPAGRRVRFQMDLSKAHFFDPVSTRRIA